MTKRDDMERILAGRNLPYRRRRAPGVWQAAAAVALDSLPTMPKPGDKMYLKVVTSNPGAISAGGWCAPVSTIYGEEFPKVSVADMLPEFTASRLGFDFIDRRSPTERAADDAMRARLQRITHGVMLAQHAVIEVACHEALDNGWDVNVYRRAAEDLWRARGDEVVVQVHIGIGFTKARFTVPTIIEHTEHDATDWWDD